MLIAGPLNPPAPRYWEHTPSEPGRHGGVVSNHPAQGYTASVRILDPQGSEHVETRFCLSLDEAERWLMQVVNGLPATPSATSPDSTHMVYTGA